MAIIQSKWHRGMVDTVLESSDIIFFKFKILGTILMCLVTFRNGKFTKIGIFKKPTNRRIRTQMIPKISKMKNRISQLFIAVSTMWIRFFTNFLGPCNVLSLFMDFTICLKWCISGKLTNSGNFELQISITFDLRGL